MTEHPTEKPVALVEHYIRNSTQVADTVLDPMMGSGTTMVAAIEAGRACIGIEKDPRWFEVAYQRAANAAGIAVAESEVFDAA